MHIQRCMIRDWRSWRRGSLLMTMIHTASLRKIGYTINYNYTSAITTTTIHRSTTSRVTYRSVCTTILSTNLASICDICKIHLINLI